MTSRKLLYFVPASDRPDQATKKPATPNTIATRARRRVSGSLMPMARNDIEPEYTLRAFAQIAPSAIASSVMSPTQVGMWLTKPAVGLFPYLLTLVMVAAAAPTISSTTQETNTPRPAHIPAAARLVFFGR